MLDNFTALGSADDMPLYIQSLFFTFRYRFKEWNIPLEHKPTESEKKVGGTCLKMKKFLIITSKVSLESAVFEFPN